MNEDFMRKIVNGNRRLLGMRPKETLLEHKPIENRNFLESDNQDLRDKLQELNKNYENLQKKLYELRKNNATIHFDEYCISSEHDFCIGEEDKIGIYNSFGEGGLFSAKEFEVLIDKFYKEKF